jgi:nucleotide-binding universal stress UspA family protein
VYKRVLVPVDGSALSAAILPFIAQIAGPLGSEIVLLRVVPAFLPEGAEGSRHVVIDELLARLAEAKGYLDGVAEGLAGQGVRVRVEVRRGDPVFQIAAVARELDADLIAMTTHGRSGLDRLLFGSVAGAVLRRAKIPVFLMRLTKEPASDHVPVADEGGSHARR